MARGGKRIRTVHLDVRAVASPLGRCRVGIVVPKHKHGSVERNRLKRRLRELVRLTLLPGAPPANVVIKARKEAYSATFELLGRDIVRVAAALRADVRRSTFDNSASSSDTAPDTGA